jgi:uncharacterized protein with HEPN domain
MKRVRYYNDWEIPSAIKNMAEALDRFNDSNVKRAEALDSANMFGVAALYETTVIAQIAHKLPPHLRERFSSINWSGLRDFRNALAHTTSAVEMYLLTDFIDSFFHQLREFTLKFDTEFGVKHA